MHLFDLLSLGCYVSRYHLKLSKPLGAWGQTRPDNRMQRKLDSTLSESALLGMAIVCLDVGMLSSPFTHAPHALPIMKDLRYG